MLVKLRVGFDPHTHFFGIPFVSPMFETLQSTVVLSALTLWCIHSFICLVGKTRKVRRTVRLLRRNASS